MKGARLVSLLWLLSSSFLVSGVSEVLTFLVNALRRGKNLAIKPFFLTEAILLI